jgi:hypothetical protein
MMAVSTVTPIVNELLCTLKCNFGKYPRADIMTTFMDFYNDVEIEEAKAILVTYADKCNPKLDELKTIKPRIGEGKMRRNVEDIITLYTVFDGRKEKFPPIYAADTGRVPSIKDYDMSKLSGKIDDIGNNLALQIADLGDKFSVNITEFKDLAKSLLDETRAAVTTVSSQVDSGLKLSTQTLVDDVKVSVSLVATEAISAMSKSSAALAAEAQSAVKQSEATIVAMSNFGDCKELDNNTNPWLKIVKGKPCPFSDIPSLIGSKNLPLMDSGSASQGGPIKTDHLHRKIVGAGAAKLQDAKLKSSSSGQWCIFVGRLGKDTTEGDVTDFLDVRGIKAVDVRKLKATQEWQQKSAAFRVMIPVSCKDLVMDPSLWPDNVVVRDWLFKKQ